MPLSPPLASKVNRPELKRRRSPFFFRFSAFYPSFPLSDFPVGQLLLSRSAFHRFIPLLFLFFPLLRCFFPTAWKRHDSFSTSELRKDPAAHFFPPRLVNDAFRQQPFLGPRSYHVCEAPFSFFPRRGLNTGFQL